ncbi:MAG: hypothetical protein HS104_06160 [Polyangiaceae bacterium]|nr:hypothetical protein [Polyangiaceae bacterium]MCE7893468.1 hypothetical protein [Sorangiineae bacterium PRO1]MCL4755640.1 hypothetical protein [Myxococcales bacterium]
MYLNHHLLGDADIELFHRYLAPLATDDFARASDGERVSRVEGAVTGLGIDLGKWKDLHGALGLRGDALVRRVGYVMYFFPASFVHQRSKGELCQSGGTFTLHAWLALSATGCSKLVPAGTDAGSVEFRGTHFRRYAWLRAHELREVRARRPLSELRVAARAQGDAPAWPRETVDEHVQRSIEQCEAVLRFLEPAAKAGLGVLSEVNNTDWEYE